MSDNHYKIRKGLTLQPQPGEPLNPVDGDIYYDDALNKFRVRENGFWKNMRGGGAGGINHLDEADRDAEDGVVNWVAYADAAATSPVDGIGGSPTITITSQDTVILRDLKSYRLTKDASNRQGEGLSVDYEVDPQDYLSSKPLIVSFDYQPSANFVSGDVVVYAYDVTNSTLIGVVENGYSGDIQASDGPTRFVGKFDSVVGASEYRLIFHIASTNALAYNLDFDTVSVSPENEIPGAIMGKENIFTPTGSWIANTTYTGRWRRVGSYMEIQYRAALSGIPTSATLTFNVPAGYEIDTAKLLAHTDDSTKIVGFGSARDAATNSYLVKPFVLNSTTITMITNASPVANVTQAAPFAFNTGDSVEVTVMVPIVGWESSTALSTTELVYQTALTLIGGDAPAALANAPFIFPTVTKDTAGSYSTITGIYTVPSDGFYRIHGYMRLSGGGIPVNLYVNNVFNRELGISGNTNDYLPFTTVAELSKGDEVHIGADVGTDPQGGDSTAHVAFERIVDYSVFSVFNTQKTKWQRKVMTTVNTPSQMDFNNLEQGKTYRLTLFIDLTNTGNNDLKVDAVAPGAITVFSSGLSQTLTGTMAPSYGASTIFTAAASGSLTFASSGAGTLAANNTFAILEELMGHEVTTQWT